jgi:hypothetical protein
VVGRESATPRLAYVDGRMAAPPSWKTNSKWSDGRWLR